MNQIWRQSVSCLSCVALVLATSLSGCSEKTNQPQTNTQSNAPATADQSGGQNSAQSSAPGAAQGGATTAAYQAQTPETLDELVAPIALYPDQLLGQVLVTATNPQEVLDLGNWLLQNQNLKGDAAATAAKNAGFSPSAQYLALFPQVVDNMCQEMDWTRQLGEAFKADQQGVMDAVQRKRLEAQRTGNLKSGAQLTVDTQTENGQQYVEIKPTDPNVVYVPQYNPDTVYTTPAPAAPAQATTVVTQQSGVSTQTAALVGLLSFGVGMAIGAAISSNNNYYPYPAWGYRGMYYGGRPYYPPPYRPPYYPGYRPVPYYRPPANYHWNQYNRNVNVNVNNNYYNRYNNNNYNRNTNNNYNRNNSAQPRPANTYQGANKNNSNRPNGSNQGNYRGQSTYQGNRTGTTKNQTQVNNTSRPSSGTTGAGATTRNPPSNTATRPSGAGKSGGNDKDGNRGTANTSGSSANRAASKHHSGKSGNTHGHKSSKSNRTGSSGSRSNTRGSSGGSSQQR